ncbi:unnamed protein product [Effrenium voratum]|nr:unnamed protein product [Effrenium voratum]
MVAAGDIAGEARALAQVTQMHLALKATSMATKTATEAEELARQSGDPRTLCTTLQACAEAETAADRFTEALQMAKEALQLAEKAVKDEPMRASALACLGSVHLQMGHYDVNNPGVRSRPRGLKECLKVSEEALALHRKLGDRSGEMGGVQRIFHAHLIGQDGPASLRYAREYMEMAQQSDQKDNLGPALVSLCQAHFLCRNYEEAERANVEARAIFEKSRSHENIEVCDQIMRELKQEMARDQRPTQPMGKAHTAVGVGGFGYNSLLPEQLDARRQQARSPPSGPGLPVGGFAAAGTEMPAPEKTTPSNDKSAQRFSDGLRGAFSRQSAAAAAAARSAPEPAPVPAPAPTRSAPAMNGSTANARNGSAMNGAGTSSSSYSGRSAAGSGALGGPRSGGLGAGGLGSSRSSGYGRANGGGSYGGSSYGGGLGSSSSRYGSYGSSANSTRPGYGAPAGVPAGGFGGRGVPAGGFGGASAPERSAPQDAERRSGRSAFAGFSRSDRSTGGEE